jgi:hypothetical protein
VTLSAESMKRPSFILALIVLPLMISITLIGSPSTAGTANCTGPQVDLLILGDSQTGGSWATSYFGDFLQKCLAQKRHLRFAAYARGGTQMTQWVQSKALDHIPTVYRDAETPRKILGGKEIPVCWKRARSLIEIHRPTGVLLQFGDNLLSLDATTTETQTKDLLKIVEAAGIPPERCFFATPTYEMAVQAKRNVPAKNLANTLKVRSAIERASKGRCTLVDGTALLAASPLLDRDLLARVPVEGTTGCLGKAVNDNTHTCGAAARAWAEAVCSAIP